MGSLDDGREKMARATEGEKRRSGAEGGCEGKVPEYA